MSASQIISEIKKLSPARQKKVFFFVEKLRRAEDLVDNAAAARALAGPGANVPWTEARKKLGWT